MWSGSRPSPLRPPAPRAFIVGRGRRQRAPHVSDLLEALAPWLLAVQGVQFDEAFDGDLVGYGEGLLVQDFVYEAFHECLVLFRSAPYPARPPVRAAAERAGMIQS